jgi:bacterioferritin-associated ferredoxin
VTIPFEFPRDKVKAGDRVVVLDTIGTVLDEVEVVAVKALKAYDRTLLVKVKAPSGVARRIAGIRVQSPHVTMPLHAPVPRREDDAVVCRCGRVTAAEIRALVRAGYRDINEIKVVSRAAMGACGGKNCGPLIQRIFREEGVPDFTDNTRRPLFLEVPLGVFAGVGEEGEGDA